MIFILYNEFIILLLFSNWLCLWGNVTLTYTISGMHSITSHSDTNLILLSVKGDL